MHTTRTITQRALRLAAAGTVVAGVMLPVAAVAQQDEVYPTPSSTPTDPAPSVAGSGSQTGTSGTSSGSSSGDTLPVTGGQLAGLALVGLGATAAGVAMVGMGRRRNHSLDQLRA